ncbi:hypothetical protein [Cellulomonas hominis]
MRAPIRMSCAAVLSTGLLVLAGCTSQPAPAADAEASNSPVSPSGQVPVYAGTWDEWMQDYMACLRDEGWDVSPGDADEGVSIEAEVADGQENAFVASQGLCNVAVGRIPDPVLDQESVRAMYDTAVAQYECLTEAGFAPTEPPTFDVYVDRQMTGQATWDPMEGVADYDGALDACPRSASGT